MTPVNNNGASEEETLNVAGRARPSRIVVSRGTLPWWRRHMRLRTKLILVSLLLLAAIAAGMAVASYLSMSSYLTGQLDQQLRRSAQIGSQPDLQPGGQDSGATSGPGAGDLSGGGGNANGSGSSGSSGSSTKPSTGANDDTPPNPFQGPGQGAEFVTLRVANGTVDTVRSGYLDVNRQKQALSAADVALLEKVPAGSGPTSVDLQIGAYRVEAVEASDSSLVVVGLPLASVNDTLNSLRLTAILMAVVGLIACGVAGTVLIRRALQPLEHVSEVANRVAELPLESGEVELIERIEPSDNETEVGRVAFALNRMLDNVGGALAARQESETKVRQFVADASHELRTPLTSIRGYSDLVVRTQPLDDDGRESMARVRSQAMRMQNLVDDLLLLARYDEGRESLFAEMDFTQLVVEAATDAEISDASASGRTGLQPHQWNIDVPAEPVMIIGDETQLNRAVANLLSNAKKHTAPGTSVRVTLSIVAGTPHGDSGDQVGVEAGRGVETGHGMQGNPAGKVVLKIADSGHGILPEFLPRIFDRFARADAARSGSDGTTGLGLPIVKAIVESHGGVISVASSSDGTEFTLTLPA